MTPQGLPHVVPVVFALADDFVYTAVDGKPKSTRALQRLANIEVTGRASLLVDDYSEDWSSLWWVRVDGPAQVLPVDSSKRVPADPEHPDQVRIAVEALTRKYPQYVRAPPPGPVIALRVTRWQWWEATTTP